MTNFLAEIYPWTKAFHIMSVIAWMAGLFYLPRLFVYHAEQTDTQIDTGPVFQQMEAKLLRVIMNPAMIATWLFGGMLVFTPGIVNWGEVWPWTKMAGVVAMTWFHHWLALRRKDFAASSNTVTGRQYRIMNEVPTLLMALIVLSVVVKF
jgi:putative membrane protein